MQFTGKSTLSLKTHYSFYTYSFVQHLFISFFQKCLFHILPLLLFHRFLFRSSSRQFVKLIFVELLDYRFSIHIL